MVSTRRSANKKTEEKPLTSPGRKPAQKVKDKVGSPSARARRGLAAKASIVRSSSPLKECSSDEFQHSDNEDARSSIDYTSDTSQVSTGSQRQRLPYNLQRSLLLDIFKNGGIQFFDQGKHLGLARLCDKRTHLYGERGDPLRERIGKKVVRWKLLHREEPKKWAELLETYSIKETSLPYQPEQEEEEDSKPAALPRNSRTSQPVALPTQSFTSTPFASLHKDTIPAKVRTAQPSNMSKYDNKSNTGECYVLTVV